MLPLFVRRTDKLGALLPEGAQLIPPTPIARITAYFTTIIFRVCGRKPETIMGTA